MDLMRDGASLSLDWTEELTVASEATATAVTTESVHRQTPNDTIVLQPKQLEGEAGIAFERSLAQAIREAEVILIDLIWIERTNSTTLDLLLKAMQQAAHAGKSLSFLSMDAASQQALDRRWENDITASLDQRQEIFAPDFEQFLANAKARKEATMLAVDIASKRQW